MLLCGGTIRWKEKISPEYIGKPPVGYGSPLMYRGEPAIAPVVPPSITISAACRPELSSEARNTTALATSTSVIK